MLKIWTKQYNQSTHNSSQIHKWWKHGDNLPKITSKSKAYNKHDNPIKIIWHDTWW